MIGVSGGIAVARAIPGARFLGFSGMGHDLPRALWLRLIDGIAANAARADGTGKDDPSPQAPRSRSLTGL